MMVAGGSGEGGEEVTGVDAERCRLSGSNCRSEKRGRLHPGGPGAGDGEPEDELTLPVVERFLVVGHA